MNTDGIGIMPYRLYGKKVVLNENLVVPVNVEIKRTWKERFFSRPWRPLKATKIMIKYKPSPDIMVVGNDTWIMHPDTMAKIAEQIGTLVK